MSTYWNKTLTSERTIQKEAIATDSDSINSHEKKTKKPPLISLEATDHKVSKTET